MAIIENGMFVFNYKELDKRTAIWMFNNLPEMQLGINRSSLSIGDIKNVINDFSFKSSEHRRLLENLRCESSKHIVPTTHLSWIQEKENIRLLRWIRRRYAPFYSQNPTYPKIDPNCPNEDVFDQFVLSFDLWDAPLDLKTNEINSLKNEWSQHILLDKRYKWIDAKNEEQALWAWQYIQSRRYTKFNHAGIHRYNPLNTKEYYESVLSVFDCWTNHPAELKLQIEEMKKAWSQLKYRKGLEGKKQCTFVLKDEVKRKLDRIAEMDVRNLNEVLERLINEEHFRKFPPKK